MRRMPREMAYDRDGHDHFVEGDAFAHRALPGFTFACYDVFAVLDRPR
jgi:hypothetical protein